jgi:hypothetical protein
MSSWPDVSPAQDIRGPHAPAGDHERDLDDVFPMLAWVAGLCLQQSDSYVRTT